MNGHTRNTSIESIEDKRAAQQWLHQNGDNVAGIEQKLEYEDDDDVPERNLYVTRKLRRKDDGPVETICAWVVRHQIGMSHNNLVANSHLLNLCIGLSLNLLVLLALTHICFPLARRHTRKFFKLSYYNAETDSYRAGWNDIWMVTFWIVAFTGLRATVMDYILTPLGKRCGIKTPRDETRFAEQAWLITYYMVFWPIGMVSVL